MSGDFGIYYKKDASLVPYPVGDNLLHNSAFSVHQVNNTLDQGIFFDNSVTGTPVTDRWYNLAMKGATFKKTSADNITATRYFKITPGVYTLAVNSFHCFGTGFEAATVKRMIGKKLTFSFKIKSSVAGNYNVRLFYSDTANNSNIRNEIIKFTIDTPNVWKSVTMTTSPVPDLNYDANTNPAVMYIQIMTARSLQTSKFDAPEGFSNIDYHTISNFSNFGASPADNMCIADLKLEEGVCATPYVEKSYSEELASCKYYYEKVDIDPSPLIGHTLLAHRTAANANTYIASVDILPKASLVTTFQYIYTGINTPPKLLKPNVRYDTFTIGSSSISNNRLGFAVTPTTNDSSTVDVLYMNELKSITISTGI